MAYRAGSLDCCGCGGLGCCGEGLNWLTGLRGLTGGRAGFGRGLLRGVGLRLLGVGFVGAVGKTG